MNPPITYSRIELTQEQKRILALLAVDGLTQDQVALEIGRSQKTVKRHISRIREVVGAVSLNQVIAIAVSRGWIPAPKVGKRGIMTQKGQS
jgi:DNA-binding NarL/FixJ family response regulator